MKVSIIVPIYNTDFRIHRCIESIMHQTFTDYECLMVDDGSDKPTANIVDSYAKCDPRFVALHKKNGGVSSARNYGIEHAKGTWLVFVDSDDQITPNHLERLMSAASEDVDIVMTGFEDVRPDESWFHKYCDTKYIGIEGLRTLFEETDFLQHQIPWDRAYRNKFSIGARIDMRFDNQLSLGEDRLFCYEYLRDCKGIATISDITYIHDAMDMNSLTYKKYSSEINYYKYKTFKKAISDIKELFSLKDIDFLRDYLEGLYSLLISSYRSEGKIYRYCVARVLHKLNLL